MSGSVKSMRMSAFFAFLATAAVVASALIGTNTASADSIQAQSYQRASQSEACAAQPGETPWQASWGPDSSWSPSYEMWANNGVGGWTCTRSITWARTPVSSGPAARTYALGDTGPGGGLVFLISGGKTYEMAEKAWSGAGTPDAAENWCNVGNVPIAGADGTGIGDGSANTTAMVAACSAGAGVSARAYLGGGFTDWFLPSQDELNAMYGYKDSIVDTAKYGFATDFPWSSSQFDASNARALDVRNGAQLTVNKSSSIGVRPIRSF